MTDRTVATRLVANNSNFDRAYLKSTAIARKFANSLDTTDGRMTNIIQTGLALGPALVPTLAAGGAAALALGSGLAAAATGMGVAALAFHGVGDALEAVNTYQLEPTVENLDKAREALAQMSPAGVEFVGFLQRLRPKLHELQDLAQQGLLPGVQEGIGDLMTSFPIFERIVGNLSMAMGHLSTDAGQALSGPFWDDFFDFIATEGPRAIDTFGRAIGNLVTGFAGMAQSFGPLGQDISDQILQLTRDFAQWGTTLDDNQGFQAFIGYVRSVGPQAWETLGALADAMIALVQAAAPVGTVVLPVIEVLADGLAAIADSPAGPILIGLAAGLSAVSRAIALYNVANGSAMMSFLGPGLRNTARTATDIRGASTAFLAYGDALDNFGGRAANAENSTKRLRSSLAGIGKAGAGIAGITLLMSDFDDQTGFANTAALTMAGTMAGPWGAAAGAAAGVMMDFVATNDAFEDSLTAAQTAMADTTGFAAQEAALKSLRTEAEELDDFDVNWQDLSPNRLAVRGAQEAWGELFGGDSATEQADKLEAASEQAKQAISDLSEAVSGKPIPLDNFEQLETTVDRMRPAFASVGMDIDQWLDNIRSGGFAAVTAAVQFEVYRDAIVNWQSAQDSLPGRSQAVTDAIAGLDDELMSTAESAEALEAALEELLGPGLGLSEATDAWIASLRSLQKELNKNNQTLVGNSKAALQNREAIRTRVEAMVDVLNAEAKAGAGSERLSRVMGRQRDALLDAADAAGVSRGQLRAYLRELGFTPKLVSTIIKNNAPSQAEEVEALRKKLDQLPPEVVTAMSVPGAIQSRADVVALAKQLDLTDKDRKILLSLIDNASGGLSRVLELLGLIDGRTATATVNTVYTSTQGGHVVPNADGSVTDYYADGDIRNGHVAQIAPAGSYRVWAEEETGGESYIPLAASKRQRSLRVWAETGRRLGVRGFADGDVTGGKPLADKTVDALVAGIRDQFGKQSPLVDIIRQWLEGLKRSEFSQAAFADRFEKALYRQVDPALRAFNVSPRQDRGETRSELRELLQVLKETFGPDAPVVARMERMGDRLLQVAEKQDKAAAKFERATDKYDAIVERERQLESAVRAAFTHDAFGSEINSVRESLIQLRADANDADRANRQFARLSRKGLDDSVLRQLGESGNTALIAQLSGMTRKQIANYERAFLRRNRELGQLGQFVGNRVFGDERQEQLRIVHRTERTLNHLNHRLSRIEGNIRDGAYHGVKQAIEGRARRQRGRRGAGAVR